MPSFHIRIDNADLNFAAGHFITLGDNLCERLHGHTYHVALKISGPLDDNQFVVDFPVARDILKKILAALDHRMLLPTQHPAIRVTANDGQVDVAFQGRRWSFPEDDCLLLPIANTTTELLAQYIGEQFLRELAKKGVGTPSRVTVAIDEGDGNSAICELP